MGLDARKLVFGGLLSKQAQTSLHIRADWSAPLLFAFWKVSSLNMLQAKFDILAILCSWGDWFESHFDGNPEGRFSRYEAHITLHPYCIQNCQNSTRSEKCSLVEWWTPDKEVEGLNTISGAILCLCPRHFSFIAWYWVNPGKHPDMTVTEKLYWATANIINIVSNTWEPRIRILFFFQLILLLYMQNIK